MPNNSLITLLGTELTTNNNVGREVERPTLNQVVEKKINYQILYKMVESAVEEIMLEYPNDPIVDELKTINLTEEGIIDSLDIVSLASYLEEKFGKEIDITDDNTLKAFSNFENIVKLVL